MIVSPQQIGKILGGRSVLERRVRTLADLDEIVRAGLPKRALDAFIDRLKATTGQAEFAIRLRNGIVPRATYNRVDRLNRRAGETVERLARLYAIVLTAFEDAEAATRFMSRPHPELGERIPFEVALSEIGGRRVEEVIERGLHGLPA